MYFAQNLSTMSKNYLKATDTFGVSIIQNMKLLQLQTMWVQEKKESVIRDKIKRFAKEHEVKLRLEEIVEEKILDLNFFESFKAYVLSDPENLIICFRGSGSDELPETLINAVKDARFLNKDRLSFISDAVPRGNEYRKIKVHKGFYQEYCNYRKRLLAIVNKAKHKNKNIYITGHSLGGALAMLFSFEVAVNLKRKVYGYYYGAPRVGGKDFMKAFNREIPHSYRIVLQKDPIPKIPFSIKLLKIGIEYYHAGKLLQLNAKGQQIALNKISTKLKVSSVVSDFKKYHNKGIAYGKALNIFQNNHNTAKRCAKISSLAKATQKERELSQ